MTAIAAHTRADRRRLLEHRRERELADLDRLMRESGTLAEAPEPVPLHRTGRDETQDELTAEQELEQPPGPAAESLVS